MARLIINEKKKKNGTKKGCARLVVQRGVKTVNSSALPQFVLVRVPLNICLEPSGNNFFPKFSFIIILALPQHSHFPK
jgi:hypothetical protein